MYDHKNQPFVFGKEVEFTDLGGGVIRKILAYSDDLMICELHFKKGAVGALHQHPHTQISYVVSGEFEFTIGGETKVVRAGDTLIKTNGVEHGCVCTEDAVLLDVFTPMREEFVK